jgi:hypothetical protein
MIIFSEKTHNYTHVESGNKLIGWTTLISKFSKVFDRENQLICSAYKLLIGDERYNELVKGEFGKLYDLNQEEVASFLKRNIHDDITHLISELSYEWDYSNILGSKFHKDQEMISYLRGYEINPFTEDRFKTVKLDKEHDNQSAHDCLLDLEDGYYPELLVWDYSMDQSLTPVTQVDRCFIETVDGVRYVDIDDYKTNKKRPYKSASTFLKAPLDKINDSSEDKYKLQAMFGAKLMETHGFTPRYCAFTHYLNYDLEKAKMYPVKYDNVLMDNFQLAWKNFLSI